MSFEMWWECRFYGCQDSHVTSKDGQLGVTVTMQPMVKHALGWANTIWNKSKEKNNGGRSNKLSDTHNQNIGQLRLNFSTNTYKLEKSKKHEKLFLKQVLKMDLKCLWCRLDPLYSGVGPSSMEAGGQGSPQSQGSLRLRRPTSHEREFPIPTISRLSLSLFFPTQWECYFSFLFPFPKVGNSISYSRSRSRMLGTVFLIPNPIPVFNTD